MSEITEEKIQAQMRENSYEYGTRMSESYAHEFAELQLKDLQRKGCLLNGPDCRGCDASGNCPMVGWEKRHPEYVNDELAHKIYVLECGGEENWQEVQRRRQEAAKEAAKATDADKADASRHVLNLYCKSKVDRAESTFLSLVNDILNAETKDEVKALVAKVTSL